jgi:hypothetical protein
MNASPSHGLLRLKISVIGWVVGLDADGSENIYRAAATCARELIRKRGSIRRAFLSLQYEQEA